MSRRKVKSNSPTILELRLSDFCLKRKAKAQMQSWCPYIIYDINFMFNNNTKKSRSSDIFFEDFILQSDRLYVWFGLEFRSDVRVPTRVHTRVPTVLRTP